MKVRITDIPREGLNLDFLIDSEIVAKRVNEPLVNMSDESVPSPMFVFNGSIPVKGLLTSEGETLELKCSATYNYTTVCNRCVGEAKKQEETPVFLILQRKSKNDQDDDINYAHYEGDELDCSAVVEDVIVQSMPFHVLCNEDCKGLCPKCGKNLNLEICSCTFEEEQSSLSPFAKLKSLKIQ